MCLRRRVHFACVFVTAQVFLVGKGCIAQLTLIRLSSMVPIYVALIMPGVVKTLGAEWAFILVIIHMCITVQFHSIPGI